MLFSSSSSAQNLMIDRGLRINNRLSPQTPTPIEETATTATVNFTTTFEGTNFLQLNNQNDAIKALFLSQQQEQATGGSKIETLALPSRSSKSQQLIQSTSEEDTISYADPLIQYVNFKIVRKMIAQNLFAVVFISVIIIYLIYYFTKVSRCPKLIGNSKSKFVEFIRKSFKHDTLSRRFSPLIYFWGTNMQTALFGYLQGQSSLNEVPRNEFNRQYLYVSDAQYLNSNVDLSKHYLQQKDENHKRIKSKCKKKTTSESKISKNLQNTTNSKRYRLVQLQVNCNNKRLPHREGGLKSQVSQLSALDRRNITSALDDILSEQENNKNNLLEHQVGINNNHQLHGMTAKRKSLANNAPSSKANNNESDLEESDNLSLTYTKRVSTSSSGSSSDSGVYADSGGGCGASSERSSLSSANCKISATPSNECDCSHLLYATSGFCHLLALNDENTNHIHHMQKEQLEFGQCALDWYKPSHKHYHKNKLVALISAGMTTGSDKKYVTDTVKTLDELGYEVCVFIRRGVGGLKLSSGKFFSPAKWRDIEAAILSIREQRPGAHLVSVGFSFGSIELCRYMSMSRQNSLIDAALLVSCPFDPAGGGDNMRKRLLNRKIDAYLAKHLGKQLHEAMLSTTSGTNFNNPSSVADNYSDVPTISGKMELFEKQSTPRTTHLCNYNGSLVNLAALPKLKSLTDFEFNYNRVLQNYPNGEAYATDSNLKDHLAFIETPTLCLSSEDDFMAPLKLLPLKQIEANKNLCMILTKKGGHMAFINGLLWPEKPYFAQRIIGKYMESVKVMLSSGQFSSDKFESKSKRDHHFIQIYSNVENYT